MEQIVAVPVPLIREETRRVILLILQGRISDYLTEQIVDVAVREIPEQTVDVVNVVPQERVRQHTGIVDMPVPQAFKRLNMT